MLACEKYESKRVFSLSKKLAYARTSPGASNPGSHIELAACNTLANTQTITCSLSKLRYLLSLAYYRSSNHPPARSPTQVEPRAVQPTVFIEGYIASGFIAETVHPFDNKTFDLSKETAVADMLRWAASLEEA